MSDLASVMDVLAIHDMRPCPECGALVETRRWHDLAQVRRGPNHGAGCPHYLPGEPVIANDGGSTNGG
jgi:hypothetical protein